MIQHLTFSEVGGHTINEDAFVVRPHPDNPECWIACLADGQGGRAGGARAAQLACETIATLTEQYSPTDLAKSPDLWQYLLNQTDATVCHDHTAGFTTLIGLGIHDDQLAGASCGDSAAVVLSTDKIFDLTAHQHKNPPVGSGEADNIPFQQDLVSPWRLLLVSDGVWKYAGWDKMVKTLLRVSGALLLTELQEAARLRGVRAFPDDFTVVLLEAPG